MIFCEEAESVMKKEGENQRKLSKTEPDREACQALPSSSGKWQLAGKGLLDMVLKAVMLEEQSMEN